MRRMKSFTPFGMLLAATLSACAGRNAPPPVPDRIDTYGGLELITHTRAYRAGDTGHIGQTRDGSLRWQGRPLVIDSRGGLFGDTPQRVSRVNAAFVLEGGPVPDLIVNVGDPNNTSAFHLLRQRGGVLETPLLCISLSGDNTVGWLDPVPPSGGRPRQYAGPQFEVLAPGRVLMLGSRCVLDVATMRAMRVPEAPGMTLWQPVPPLGLSPDGRRIVRAGTVDGVVAASAATGRDEPVPHLLVADLTPADDGTVTPGGAPRGRWQPLPIDARRMRYADPQTDLDATWLAHHFEWKREADGHWRLAVRAGFKPLPWRGRYGSSGGGEYTLPGAQRDLRPALLLPMLRDRFGAQTLPASGGDDRLTQLSLRGETLVVHPLGLWVASARTYVPGKPGDPALQKALIKEIGDAVDAELATGRHDGLFARP